MQIFNHMYLIRPVWSLLSPFAEERQKKGGVKLPVSSSAGSGLSAWILPPPEQHQKGFQDDKKKR